MGKILKLTFAVIALYWMALFADSICSAPGSVEFAFVKCRDEQPMKFRAFRVRFPFGYTMSGAVHASGPVRDLHVEKDGVEHVIDCVRDGTGFNEWERTRKAGLSVLSSGVAGFGITGIRWRNLLRENDCVQAASGGN